LALRLSPQKPFDNLSLLRYNHFLLSRSSMAPSLSKTGSDANTLVDGHNQSPITLEGSNFLANGHVILSDVPDNIIATPSPYTSIDKSTATVGCFVGFNATKSSSRHVVPIGKLRDIKFMSIFRFKVWWTTHWVGSNGRDLEHETRNLVVPMFSSFLFWKALSEPRFSPATKTTLISA